MAKILGLGGVFFKSKDPENLAKWYQKWLNMEMAFPYGMSFKPEAIPENGYQVWGAFKQETEYFMPGSKDYMFNLMVDDLDAMLEQLKPSGCQIMADTEKSEYGYFGWFIDPDGNKVELWQPPEKPPSE
ncbi:VOC family protein [Aliikangiella coralliicola]|uniref:VOC family protein n=1 Tax=Aliikangiella coralliicola TaxID=2592383 RepID=A0A545UIE7_9GAMM|nr:VOC family protein [Aliikangiella coralliicola]TQV89230.1 VOC family protein [Aliikangiella coralliicola]